MPISFAARGPLSLSTPDVLAALDPNQSNTSLTFTNNNLTVTGPSDFSGHTAKSTMFNASGKRYCEFRLDVYNTPAAPAYIVGLAAQTTNLGADQNLGE